MQRDNLEATGDTVAVLMDFQVLNIGKFVGRLWWSIMYMDNVWLCLLYMT